MAELLANNFSTTVAGAATGVGVGSKQVAATTGLVANALYRFLIESEIVIGLLVDATHINFLVRGAEGTTAADHAIAVTLTNILTAAGARMTVLDPSPDYAVIGEDDFCNHTSTNAFLIPNWVVNTVAGGLGQIISTAGHPGLVQLSTGATASGAGTCAWHNNSNALLSSDLFDLHVIFKLDQIGAGAEGRFGLADDVNLGQQNAFYIEKLTADTNWFYNRLAATVATRTDSTIACDTAYHRFRIRRIDASTIGFSIDGVEITTTTGAPATQNLGPIFQMKNPAVAVDKTMTIDKFRCIVTGLSR